ncbi:hypothetical protein K1T73_13400 [Roseovarius sp. SCSIO 43702]|uniref:hypothetical protein n=1 Tax=Roseovarius sp. SCSIO 43702 TaxID=2823043 RepID=UPI001C7386F0|nr:hypothetical protein [Roseovarius sp. SCSIO 43702]QYX56048.1 hypothetical protein K1T73_13400 [Roseovarius sp. SCSIO 43702]
MKRWRDPVFTERRTYRRRRMTDAATLLPFFGAGLFLLPMVWGGPDLRTSTVILFLFPVWAGLCVLSVIVSRDLESGEEDGTQEMAERPPDEEADER